MKVAGITLVKDEADIIGHTLGWMARQVDFLVVADNGSTDGTLEIIERLGRYVPIVLEHDDDPAHYQSRKMSTLAEKAARMGAGWVVPFDADEVWYAPYGRLANVLRQIDADIVPATLYNHFATGLDPLGHTNPLDRMVWRSRTPGALPKVACRVARRVVIEEGNHGAHFPEPRTTAAGFLAIRHFPYRSADQMVQKARKGAAALAATDLPEHIGQHWRDYGRLTDDQIREVFREHFYVEDPTARDDMVLDPAPGVVATTR